MEKKLKEEDQQATQKEMDRQEQLARQKEKRIAFLKQDEERRKRDKKDSDMRWLSS